jgi:hypothetical protein
MTVVPISIDRDDGREHLSLIHRREPWPILWNGFVGAPAGHQSALRSSAWGAADDADLATRIHAFSILLAYCTSRLLP